MTVYSMEIYKKKEKLNLKYCIKYFVPVIGKNIARLNLGWLRNSIFKTSRNTKTKILAATLSKTVVML